MSRPSYEELERAWNALPPQPRERGQVICIVTRVSVAQMAKRDRPAGYHILHSPHHRQPKAVSLTVKSGIVGDRWSPKRNKPGDQVSLMSASVARLLTANDEARLHMPGDNFVVDFDLSAEALPTGSQLIIGSARIEISDEPHEPCNRFQARFGKAARSWVASKNHPERHLRGRYATVIRDGEVRLGDAIVRVAK